MKKALSFMAILAGAAALGGGLIYMGENDKTEALKAARDYNENSKQEIKAEPQKKVEQVERTTPRYTIDEYRDYDIFAAERKEFDPTVPRYIMLKADYHRPKDESLEDKEEDVFLIGYPLLNPAITERIKAGESPRDVLRTEKNGVELYATREFADKVRNNNNLKKILELDVGEREYHILTPQNEREVANNNFDPIMPYDLFKVMAEKHPGVMLKFLREDLTRYWSERTNLIDKLDN
jgi:hypothetical protein